MQKITHWLNSFLKRFTKKPAPKLCTVTFIYDIKGVIGAGKNKTDTVFAWIEDGVTNHDCVSPLFEPPGIGKGQCSIKDIIVMVIPTVTAKANDE